MLVAGYRIADPTSKGDVTSGVGHSENNFFAAGISVITLYSFASGRVKSPAMVTKSLTFFEISSIPDNGLSESGWESINRTRFVEKPTETIVTEASG